MQKSVRKPPGRKAVSKDVIDKDVELARVLLDRRR
jgi:hypothetical protein